MKLNFLSINTDFFLSQILINVNNSVSDFMIYYIVGIIFWKLLELTEGNKIIFFASDNVIVRKYTISYLFIMFLI